MGRFKIKKKSLSGCGVKIEVKEIGSEDHDAVAATFDRSIQSQLDTLGYAEWETSGTLGDYEFRTGAHGEWWRHAGETEWREGEPPEEGDNERQSRGIHGN